MVGPIALFLKYAAIGHPKKIYLTGRIVAF